MSSNTDVKQMSAKVRELLYWRPLYQIRQINGQRVYGPPTDGSMVKPYKGSEVCLKGIPSDCFEDELVPFLETVGKIYRLRIAVNFSGLTRNFAFVEYENPFTAQLAVLTLNRILRTDDVIKIELSFDNKRLRIEDISVQQIDLFLGPIRAGLLQQDYNFKKRWLTLTYDSHYSASMARRNFVPNLSRVYSLDWVTPYEQSQEITSIWILSIFPDHDHHNLDFSFNILRVCEVKIVNNQLARIRYGSRKDAEKAFKILVPMSFRFGFLICWDFL